MISFIVIGRNEGWRLEKCFKGIYTFVEAESINDFEVIYVDSKSTDGSVELSKNCGNTKTILITGECNAAIARNIGAKEACGEILFFLDGDMELIPGFMSSIMKEGKLIYPFVSGLENNIWHDAEWNYIMQSVDRKYIEGKDSYEVTTGGLFIIDALLWKKAGGMDNRFRRSQDLDFGFRLTKMGYKLCRKPSLWVNHYTRAYLKRSDFITFSKYKALLIRKHLTNLTAQRFLFGVNYTAWGLFFTMVLLIVFMSLFPIVLYLLLLCYRTYRELLRNNFNMNPMLILWGQIKDDFYLLGSLLLFWPKDIAVKYDVK